MLGSLVKVFVRPMRIRQLGLLFLYYLLQYLKEKSQLVQKLKIKKTSKKSFGKLLRKSTEAILLLFIFSLSLKDSVKCDLYKIISFIEKRDSCIIEN